MASKPFFPAPSLQSELAKQEVAEVKDKQGLLLLEKAADGVDSLLQNTAAKACTGHLYKNVVATGDSKVLDGNTYGKDWVGEVIAGISHTYDGVRAEGNAKVQNGERYGAEDFFDD